MNKPVLITTAMLAVAAMVGGQAQAAIRVASYNGSVAFWNCESAGQTCNNSTSHLFGSGSLNGAGFNLRVVFDPAVAPNYYSDADFSVASGGSDLGRPAYAYGILTINGQSVRLDGTRVGSIMRTTGRNGPANDGVQLVSGFTPQNQIYMGVDFIGPYNPVDGYPNLIPNFGFNTFGRYVPRQNEYGPNANITTNPIRYQGNFVFGLNTGSYVSGALRTASVVYSAGAVPEPNAWALLIMGFGLTGALARRRHGKLKLQVTAG